MVQNGAAPRQKCNHRSICVLVNTFVDFVRRRAACPGGLVALQPSDIIHQPPTITCPSSSLLSCSLAAPSLCRRSVRCSSRGTRWSVVVPPYRWYMVAHAMSATAVPWRSLTVVGCGLLCRMALASLASLVSPSCGVAVPWPVWYVVARTRCGTRWRTLTDAGPTHGSLAAAARRSLL